MHSKPFFAALLLVLALAAPSRSWAECDTDAPPTCAYISVSASVTITPTAFTSPSPSCQKVTNNACPDQAMVSTGSQDEWSSFITNHESCLVLAGCCTSNASNVTGTCSASCGGGTQTISIYDSCGALESSGSQACNTQACPINAVCGDGRTCAVGSLASYYQQDCETYIWVCSGINGGADAVCSGPTYAWCG